ncbi:ZBED5 protein, partial [Amia calva]|nr:ZBED5 protein [Amia calva]
MDGSEDCPDALCVVCKKPGETDKIKRHLESQHPDLVAKDGTFFHAIAENLIKPCVRDASVELNETAAHQSDSVSLCNSNTMANDIASNLTDVLDQVVKIVNLIKSRPLKGRLFSIISDDMGSLHTSLLTHGFPIETGNCDWIRNPFNSSAPEFTNKEMQQYIELACYGHLQLDFSSDNLIKFWAKVQRDFPDIATQALLKILPFATTYLCETGFSSSVSTKNKIQEKLNAEPEMYISCQLSHLISSVFARRLVFFNVQCDIIQI